MTAPEVTQEVVADSVQAFRPMLPTLTGYVRAMLGNSSVTVEPGPVTQTDGKRIMVRPPLALATLPEHQREMCGKRDGTGTLVCESCATREDILVKVRHEIGHIAHGSFERFRLQGAEVEKIAQKHGLECSLIPVPKTDRARALLDWAAMSPDTQVGTLTMILEDVRIDRANATHSDGGAAIYRAFLERTLTYGVEGGGAALGRPLPEQVMLGLLSVPHGVDVTVLLGEDAQEILADDEVVKILAATTGPSRRVIALAYRLYRRLIDLGVLPDPEDKEKDPEPDAGEDESEDAGDGEEAQGSQKDDDDAGDPGDEGQHATGDEDSGGSDESQEEMAPGEDQGGQEDDAANLRRLVEAATGHDINLDGDFEIDESDLHKLVTRAEKQLDHLGEVRQHISGVNLYGRRRPDGLGDLFGRSSRAETLSTQDPSESLLGALVGQARTVFSANAALHRHRNATRGRVSPTVLGKRAWNPDDQRLFERRQRNDAPSYSVLIGMDNSGSTSTGTIARSLREATLAAATMCQRVGVEVSIYAHTTGQRTVDLYEIKGPEDPWTPRIGADLRTLAIGATNYDGSTITAYRRILAGRRATRKVLLYFTDGQIPGAGGAPEADIMRREVTECRRQGVTLLGVGAHTSSPEQFGIPTVRLDRVEDVRKVLEFLAKEFGI